MIITIDGPTASGKSTIAQLLAEQLSALYINSGLLFRAVAYILQSRGYDVTYFNSHESIAALINDESVRYEYTPGTGVRISFEEKDITPFLKTPDIDRAASLIATQPSVRQALLNYQRKLADDFDAVADGRDCGTVVFPEADYKFYITADLRARAMRWQRTHNDHKNLSLEEIEKIIAQRDKRDSSREIAPLKPAHDALIIDTSNMTIQEVLNTLRASMDKQFKKTT